VLFGAIRFLMCSLICRGTDVSIENMHQGFTHVFESTFESTEGIKEYIEHPAHVEFASVFLPVLEKVLIIDYKPTSAN
jgi:hypothetical protein